MNNWRYRLAAFMQGRYGIDSLYKALVGAYFGLFLINLFVRSQALSYLTTALVIYAFYRVFSRKTAQRSAENRRFLALWRAIRQKLMQSINRVREYRTHRYRSCPNCRTTLRLTRKIGTLTVTCPKCRTTFQVTIRH